MFLETVLSIFSSLDFNFLSPNPPGWLFSHVWETNGNSFNAMLNIVFAVFCKQLQTESKCLCVHKRGLILGFSAGVAAGGRKQRGQEVLWLGRGRGRGRRREREREEGWCSCHGQAEALRDGSRPQAAPKEHQTAPAEPQCSCESAVLSSDNNRSEI